MTAHRNDPRNSRVELPHWLGCEPPFTNPLCGYGDEILTRLVSTTDSAQALQSIAEAAARLLGAPKASISLREAEGLRTAAKFIEPDGYFEFARAAEVGRQLIPRPEHPSLYAVAEDGQPRITCSPGIHDLKERFTGQKVTERPEFCYLREPIRFEGAVIGVLSATLEATAARTLGEHHRALLRRLLKFAGIAINNARLIDELKRANRAKDELLATITHELKTPLVAIRLAAEAMLLGRLGQVSQAQVEAAGVIERAVDREAFLIDKVLEYCRSHAGRAVLRSEPLDLSEVVAAALKLFSPPAAQKGISLRTTPAPGAAFPVAGDRVKLEMVVGNLVENAIKFSPRGSAVTVSLERRAGLVRLSVADQGPGIPAAEREAIFERFHQAGNGHAYGGAGIGLAVVRALVELHGGRVELESASESGSRFTLSLPARSG